jgi:two-component system sensor kinase FixL
LRAPNRDDTVLTSARELLDQTVEQASRAGQIIRATREFLSRGDVRRVQARLADLVRAVIDLMRGETVQNQVSIVTQIDPNLPPLLVDPIQVEQVVLNLVRNSIEAMSREPGSLRQITVAATASAEEPGFAEITVQDTGPGLPADIAERLFTPFTTTKESGMGLGLSISRSIVEAHGGHITIASNDAGRGVTIRFTLPFDSEQ